MTYITKTQIEAVTNESELRNLCSNMRNKKISNENQRGVFNKCIEYSKFYALDNLAITTKITDDILNDVVNYPKEVKEVMVSNGFANTIIQMNESQIFNLIDSLKKYASTSSSNINVWTHFYQKTLNHIHFRSNPSRMLPILKYAVENRIFNDSQYISNIVEYMTVVDEELVDWLVSYGDSYRIFGNLLAKSRDKLTTDMLEMMYFKVTNGTIKSIIAMKIRDRGVDTPAVFDCYAKNPSDTYAPNSVRETFFF